MPANRELTMRQIRQMLRLHYERVGDRQIARTLGIARSTVQDNLKRALKAGVTWPVPAEWTDDVLDQRLFARGGVKPGRRRHGARYQTAWVNYGALSLSSVSRKWICRLRE